MPQNHTGSTTMIEHPDNTYTAPLPLSIQQLCDSVSHILLRHFERGQEFVSPEASKTFLSLALGAEKNEKFSVIYLDNAHRLLSYECLFSGTMNGASVYPRVIIERGLSLGAAAVILAHNHPSGLATPSQADKDITQTIVKACSLVDIRVLDHCVIAGTEVYSFAEAGLM